MNAWPSDLNVIEYPSAAELAGRLAADVARQLSDALHERGVASLMVSGGSTPLPFFAALARQQIPWQQVTIGLVDERWVDSDHVDSNEKLVRDNLLTHNAADAGFVSSFAASRSADAHLFDYNAELLALLLAHGGQFDVTVLGMGNDAHTASLFPITEQGPDARSENSDVACLLPGAADDALTVVTRPQTAPHTRIGLSVTGILRSRVVVLHINGQSKKQTLLDALASDDPMGAPVSSIFAHTTPLVYWSL